MVKQRRVLSAGYGLNGWLQQRITALIMLVGIIVVFAFLLLANKVVGSSFVSWQQFFGFTFVKVFMQVVILAVILHAWIGIRDLWMDYVKSMGLRLTLHTLTVLWLLGSLIYSVKILWA
ncbi:MAG: succinate dehydrogenase, hydrophobic membrane anchor protein [Neisseriales bacterium]|jgi:succinate dehydrogenase / fumarate reductase membrane anchor subunit|nr:MAG: succinate dehydrogenase, hydrophobic membrane anchor protein [Neisseriales bacterium]